MQRDAQTIRDEYHREADKLKADPQLSNRGKQERLDELHERLQAELHDLRDREVADLTARRDRLVRESFGPVADPGVSPSEARSDQRDALARADAAEAPEDALRLLDRAERVGDRQLAVAVASVAHERSWSGVLRRAAEASGRGDKLGELARTHDALHGPAAQVGRSMSYSLPRPKM